MKRFLAILVGLLGIAFMLAGPASAHATLVTSSPADGARLNTAPHTVTITFDESVGLGNLGYLHVTNQAGKRVDARAAYHPGGDGTKIADDLQSGLGDGTYTASFRVISADSHPVAGTIQFVVGNGPLVRGVTGGSTVNSGSSVAFDVVRWISYAGLALLGGAWLILLLWPAGRDDRRARGIVWTGWGGATLGAALELLMQGPYSAGAGLAKLGSWSLLDDTLHTQYGTLHCIRLVLLGALAVGFARSLQPDAQPARWEAALALVGVGIAWTFSAAGHGATTPPTWISVPDDMLHVLAMATWIGGLVMLVGALLPRREPDEIRAALPLFSRVAFTSVVVLALSGTYSAFRGVGTVNAIFTTTYGWLVVGKVLLLLAILAVANVSRRLVRRRTVAYAMTDAVLVDEPDLAESPVAVERLRRAVVVEAVIGLVVLGFSAVLVAQPRGKEALLTSYREPVSASASLGGGRSVTVTADHGVAGLLDFTVELAGGGAQSVTATATQPKKQLGPLPIKLSRERADLYDGSATLPVTGDWQIALVVTTSTFQATTQQVTLTLH